MSDQRLERYAQWLVEHQDEKGTPAFEKVAEAYRYLRSQSNQTAPDWQDKAAEMLKAGLYGLQDALTLGADDEINALWKTALKKLKGEQADLGEQMKAEAAAKRQMQTEHPYVWGTGAGVGTLAPYSALNKAFKGAKALSPALAGAVTGAAQGYNSEDGAMAERLKSAAVSGAIGGVLPKALDAHAGSAGRVKKWLTPSSLPDDPHEREALLRFAKRLDEAGAKPTGSTVEALRKVKAALNANNQDLRQILDALKKEHADNPVALSEIQELRQSLGNQTADINQANLESVKRLAGDNTALKDALDMLATERDAAKRHMGNTSALFDETLAGEIGDAASRGYGRVGLFKMGTRLPVADLFFEAAQKGNRYNKALKALRKLDTPVPSPDTARNLMAEGVRKARLRQALRKLGMDEVTPDGLSQYASTLKRRMERSGIEPKGEPVQGFGLLGQLYTENGVDPDVFIRTSMEVARKEDIPLEKLAVLISESASKEGKQLMSKIRAALQEKGLWQAPDTVRERFELRRKLMGLD